MATPDTKINLAIALTSSINPLAENILFSPAIGLIRSGLKASFPPLNDQPPSIEGVIIATIVIRPKNGAIPSNAIHNAFSKRMKTVLVSRISTRLKVKLVVSISDRLPNIDPPSSSKPVAPNTIILMVFNSLEIGTCPCCCASRNFLAVGCSVFS